MNKKSKWASIVTLIGGVRNFGPIGLIIHDHGVILCWRQVIKWEWRT